MSVVYPILNEVVQAFAPVCEIAKAELYKPMVAGTKLRLLLPKSTKTSLEQMLEVAASNQGTLEGTPESTPSVRDSGDSESQSEGLEDVEMAKG